MPIYWTIDSRQEFVVATAEGDITRMDAEEYLDVVDGSGALAYRKLYDGRAGKLVMNHEELMAIAARFRSYHHRPVGPLAIVLLHDQAEPGGAPAGSPGLRRPAAEALHQSGSGATLDREPGDGAMTSPEVRIP